MYRNIKIILSVFLLLLTGCQSHKQLVCEKDYVIDGALIHETYRDMISNGVSEERLHTFQVTELQSDLEAWFLTQVPQKEIVMFKEVLNQENFRYAMMSTDQDVRTGTFLISHRYLFSLMNRDELKKVSMTLGQEVLSLDELISTRTQQNFKCTQ